jgi:hypothetical protein
VPEKQSLVQALLEFGLNNYFTIIAAIIFLTVIFTILVYGE